MPQDLFVYNDALYFRGSSVGNDPDQLWRSDGTTAGTQAVTFAGPSGRKLRPYWFSEVNDMLLFTGNLGTGDLGAGDVRHIFVSDGTTAGTREITGDYNTYGSTPVGLGTRAMFKGFTPAVGEEWFRFTVADTAAPRPISAALVAGAAADAVVVRFTDNVAATVAAGDLVLTDLASGSTIPSAFSSVQYSPGDDAATFALSTTRFPGGRLPTGRYRVSMAAGSVADPAGNPMAQPFQFEFTVAPPAAAVAGRWVFYNRSSYDGENPSANAADDDAIAPDKAALLPVAAATFANATSYARGINGIMVDLKGLPPVAGGAGETLSASDFVFRTVTRPTAAGWSDAPAPSSVTVRRGAGAGSSDRVTLIWPDGAIKNTWLQVTVKANEHTGLLAPDVFYFGNLVGETGDSAAAARVSALDLAAVKRQLNAASALSGRSDFNRDGRVNALDLSAARGGLFRELELFTAPVA
jgi:ELWxxDGT repeat protein